MRRARVVLTATAIGLAGILSFHTKGGSSALALLGTTPSGSGGGSTTTTQPSTSPSTPSRGSTTTTQPASGVRSATGESVNYNYGILSVSVKVSGSKITNIGIASIDDGGNPRSQSIDQQSIPILEQQAMQVQSANIQGVSGASFTTAGFAQSLQSALAKLGLGH